MEASPYIYPILTFCVASQWGHISVLEENDDDDDDDNEIIDELLDEELDLEFELVVD
jgi:hypothetical protein